MCVLSKQSSQNVPQNSLPIQSKKTNEPPKKEESCECAICYSETSSTNESFTTTCEHTFCQGCITKWLLAKDSCPLCRANICGSDHPHENGDEEADAFDAPISANIILPPNEELPPNIVKAGINKSFNLVTYLMAEDDEAIGILDSSWNIQPSPPYGGWRSESMVYGTIINYKNTQYGIYVDTRDREYRNNIEYMSSSIIAHMNIMICPISRVFSHRARLLLSHPNVKISKRAMKQQRQFSRMRNNGRSRHHYTHR